MIKHLYDISAEFENLLEMCDAGTADEQTIAEKLTQIKRDALEQLDTEIALIYGWATVIERADAKDRDTIVKAQKISDIFRRGTLSELICYPGSWEREENEEDE